MDLEVVCCQSRHCSKYSIKVIYLRKYIFACFGYRCVCTVGLQLSIWCLFRLSETSPEPLQGSTQLLLQIMFFMFFSIKLSKCLLTFLGAQRFPAFIICKKFCNSSKKVSALCSWQSSQSGHDFILSCNLIGLNRVLRNEVRAQQRKCLADNLTFPETM